MQSKLLKCKKLTGVNLSFIPKKLTTADVSFEEYCLPSTPSPCRQLSHSQSTMGRSEFPVPYSTPTLRLVVSTCFAGGKGHSQVLARFSSSMPHSRTPVESTRVHHIAWVVSPYQIETFILLETLGFAWRTNVSCLQRL